ncbi:MAG: Gfo/Idh/MocA family oxidoreductase [Promethearchaeota archaeon]
MDKIKIGVIGTGYMGKNHMRIFSEMNGVELVAFSDINERSIKQLSSEYDVNGYVNYKTLLENEDIDALSVAVPTSLHMRVVMDIFSYKKHVLVEKPIAATIEEAKLLIKRAKQEKLVFMVGHIERFNPAILKMKELLKNHYFGDIVSLSAKRVGPYMPRMRDSGVIIDLAIHDIDVMRFLTEKRVKEVYAKLGKKISKYEDFAAILLEFEGNMLGSIEVNRLTPTKIRTLSLTCTDGFANVDYITQEISVYGKILDTDYKDYQELILKFGNPEIGKPKLEKKEPLKLELKHFIDCVRENKKPIVDGMEGLRNLEVALNALRPKKF